MKSTSRKLFATAAVLVALATAGSVSAISVDFAGNAGEGTIGNSLSFNNIQGSGVNVTVTAWSRASANSGGFAAAAVGQYGGGLGNINSFGQNGDGDHEVDNMGYLDFLLFTFNQSIDLNSIRLESIDGDSDFSLWIGNSAVLNTLYNSNTPTQNVDGGNSSNTYNVNPSNLFGSYILVAARTSGNDLDDAFKVRNMSFDKPNNTPGVPDGGSTLLLLGAALAGAGLLARRQKAA